MTQSPCIHGQYDRERGKVPGSYGHYTQDAQTFASWGVDYVKADFCDAQLPDGSLIDAEQACECRSPSSLRMPDPRLLDRPRLLPRSQ